MATIFICYRRDDAKHPAGRLGDRMIARFGRRNVFMDIDSIIPGDDFHQVLERTVAACSILFAIIGPRWIGDPTTVSRLHDPSDWVRLEIEAALNRNVRVIPVLVDGARMPRASELPPTLVPLTRRQAYELRDNTFSADADRLVATIEALPRQASLPRRVAAGSVDTLRRTVAGVSRFPRMVYLYFGVAVLVTLGIVFGPDALSVIRGARTPRSAGLNGQEQQHDAAPDRRGAPPQPAQPAQTGALESKAPADRSATSGKALRPANVDAAKMRDVAEALSTWYQPHSNLIWKTTYTAVHTRAQAEATCTPLTFARHSDWRLPTPGELDELNRYCEKSQSCPMMVAHRHFWTNSVSVS